MIVTGLEPLSQKRIAVNVDGTFAFVLYKGEIRKYGIKEGEEIGECEWEEIMQELLPKRAKLRCMNLLKAREYTRRQMLDKLKAGKYPPQAIEEALRYVESYGYINDAAYAVRYIEANLSTRSRRRIEDDLQRKGVDKSIIEQAFNETAENGDVQNEEEMILRLLEKKHYDQNNADYKEKQRMQAFLYRKGFSPGNIRRCIGMSGMEE